MSRIAKPCLRYFVSSIAVLVTVLISGVWPKNVFQDESQLTFKNFPSNNRIPNWPPFHEFRSRILPDTSIRFVLNSGICETTPGVNQISGYIDTETESKQNVSMWFWFFASRENPEKAPFTLWLNGGPGASSMFGLFTEHGPCKVNADNKSTSLNLYSWNTVSNMIYIDQPADVGFSYGTMTVNNTESAAIAVWKACQVLVELLKRSTYESRHFVLATESYGGRYGPEFATYFNEQNDLIQSGDTNAEPIFISTLIINNGWFDPLIQNQAYYTFASDAPGYGPLQNDTVLEKISKELYNEGGCVDHQIACYNAGDSTESDKICERAVISCGSVPADAIGERDASDLRRYRNSSETIPPVGFIDYLNRLDIRKRIGALTYYRDSNQEVGKRFAAAGDMARTSLPQLAKLVNSGHMRVLIWAGDTDINCNWVGAYEAMLSMEWYGRGSFYNSPLTNISLNGETIAAVANVDKFSFARVYGAGHEVPVYQPEAALAIFTMFIRNMSLNSVSAWK